MATEGTSEDSNKLHYIGREIPALERPGGEVERLEENLGIDDLTGNKSLMASSSASFEFEDLSIIDVQNVLNEEEMMEHKKFVDIANECAKKSQDPQTKVGSVVVNNKGEIIGQGCNRMPKGCQNLPLEENKDSETLDTGKHPYVVHAIAAAIYDGIRKGRFDDYKGATVYATLFPSNTCAQLIREMGIKKVVYTTNKFSKTKFRKAAQRILEPDVECRFYRTREGIRDDLMRTSSDMLDDRKVIYRNDAMEWKCEEHNFSMTFQSESLPTDTYESILEISVTPGEDYVLPVLTVPVSMFFSIKCQHKFHKNVMVSIEHFSAETSDLSFVVSSNPQPPFQFELLSGGEFNTKRCGKIGRREFSRLAVVTRIRTGRWPRMLYYCALYTNLLVDHIWTVYIYITKDSATYRNRIQEDTKDSDKKLNTYTVATVNHTIDYFTLDVSMNDEEKLCGWQLPPNTNPIRIQRRRIDRCRGIPLAANFKIIQDVSKTRNLSRFVHSYKIAGVDQENILSLTLPLVLPAGAEFMGHELVKNAGEVAEALHKAEAKWEFIGLGLGVDHNDLTSIDSTYTKNDKKLLETLKLWLEADRNTTWNAIVRVLRTESVGRHDLANEIEKKYLEEPSQSYV